ncbi:MAG: peptidase U62 [Acidobacteria bacterium Pan2503]|uniref:Peptidase U62 n=1 Tax=Candidatus Acidiferrum panamense TaxID=2741543 RepID=A0A7V8NPW5_9BACT|nr:peptidase U62 [Candidatus Acidoferrum panamensis]
MSAYRRNLGFALAIAACVPSLRAASGDSKPSLDPALAAAREAAKGDGLLEALLTELDRSKSRLKMDQVQAPYFIEYRVTDVEEYSAEAAFGALRENQHTHVRLLRVIVRIGDYKQDSFYGPGQGESTFLPLDDDSIALRHQIWLATDEAYKGAGQALAEKQAELKRFTTDANPVDDFAKSAPLLAVDPTVSLKFDATSWKRTLEDLTNLYRQYPDVQSVTASARFSAVNEYLVNTEGTVTRCGKTTYSVQFNGAAQAADGMRLSRNPGYVVARLEELPSHDALMTDAKRTLDTVVALRKAPIVEEEYRGPVLFSADAADDIVASLIGQNLVGRKPQLGRPNRTVGAFATSYKARVLPTFLSVIDDPTLKDFRGKSLIGSYMFDSEGVKAQSVDAVENGILTNYLIGRQPLRDFPASNGHGRAAPGTAAGANLGVLLLRSAEPQSPDDLKKKVTEMVKAQGMPYGYRVETLGQPGNTPRLLYRVYANDGREELVRGAVFNELDTRALRTDVIAAGNDPLVSNRPGGIPTTVISPSLLFDELEVKRADTSKDKLPEYPPPPLRK